MVKSEVYFDHLLEDLRERVKKSKLELAVLPEGSLQIEKRNGVPFYFQAIRTTEEMDVERTESIEQNEQEAALQKQTRIINKRHAINKHPEIVKGLIRRTYLERELAVLEKNVKALETMTKAFCEVAPDDILERMPERFRSFPKEYFFPQPKEDDWASQPYEQSSYKTERKIHTTSRGLLVRSKSELAISEAFYKYDVPFRYEQILEIGTYRVAPDFMPRNKRTSEQFYWEHCGMPEDEEYMRHHKWKMNLYGSVGIVPWKNLIVSYDGVDGTLNIAEIESVIKNKLL